MLSPDAFMLVLESESSNKGLSLFCFFLLVISHPAVSILYCFKQIYFGFSKLKYHSFIVRKNRPC